MANLSCPEALAWLDQCLDDAQESLASLSDVLSYLGTCWESDELPGGRVPQETERLLLAQQRKCQLAAALIRRLERQVRPPIARLYEPPVARVAPAEPLPV
jgi:hypothetical protein